MKNIIITTLLIGSIAQANVIGTAYQNFSPDISGTDFTTVHSSQPVKQCMCNLGLFFNYAQNTLSYSSAGVVGERANDSLIGADLHAAFGITNNWDIGVALPFTVTANNKDPYGVSYFDKFGLTEIRPMTKFRFYGDDEGGLAVILSANFNVIKDDPFAGVNAGPTINVELAGDTTTSGGIKLAGNIGYRKRQPGSALGVNPSTGVPVPFLPLEDSFIYSAAAAMKFGSSTDGLIELKGNTQAEAADDNIKRAQQALEVGLGIRHEASNRMNLHAGLGGKILESQASPDLRGYAGLNYTFGPLCGVAGPVKEAVAMALPTALVKNHPIGVSSQTALNMPVTALNPADYAAYRWKLGSTPNMNCNDEYGYSEEIDGQMPIVTDIGEIPDGGITLCAVAKNLGGQWQPFTDPTIINWTKQTVVGAPIAVVQNHPVGVSDVIDLNMPVTAVDPTDYAAYRWKIGSTPEMNCQDAGGYSEEIPGQTPIVTSIGEIPDGGITLCTVAKNLGGVWQSFSTPTITTWEKKKGYELFKLNANVLFDFDKDTLQKRSYYELEKINRHLNKKPFTKTIIEGHTDSKGSDEYNLDLSRRRSVRVKNYLVKTYGFEADKFITKGMGEGFPVDTNETDEGRANNRRVEFKIYRK